MVSASTKTLLRRYSYVKARVVSYRAIRTGGNCSEAGLLHWVFPHVVPSRETGGAPRRAGCHRPVCPAGPIAPVAQARPDRAHRPDPDVDVLRRDRRSRRVDPLRHRPVDGAASPTADSRSVRVDHTYG